MNTGKYLWIFGAIIVAMLVLLLVKPDWVRGMDGQPVPFAQVQDEATAADLNPCIYYWQVVGLAQITRTLDSTSAGPYPVIPILVDVDFYPVDQTITTEGLITQDAILARVKLPRPYMLGQWDPQQAPTITFVRRECPKLPPKPSPTKPEPED